MGFAIEYVEPTRSELVARIATLERELAAAQATIASDATFIKQLGDTCNAAEKEALALREDAERYRWLLTDRYILMGMAFQSNDELNAAIDAARLPSAPTPPPA